MSYPFYVKGSCECSLSTFYNINNAHHLYLGFSTNVPTNGTHLKLSGREKSFGPKNRIDFLKIIIKKGTLYLRNTKTRASFNK